MSDTKPNLSAVPNLPRVMRLARIDAAEQSQVVAELRRAEVARLELLHDAIRPVLDQAPDGVDLFDAGIAQGGARPRLFIDMIAFVEMAHDKRTYRFLQDSRFGRATLAESEKTQAMVEAITGYVARRLIEREKALAADMDEPARAPATEPAHAPSPPSGMDPARARIRRGFERALLFVIEFLGSAALFALIAAAGYWLWRRFAG